MIEFDDTFYELERDINSYMEEKYKKQGKRSLWNWAVNVPLLETRFHKLVTSSDKMINYINKGSFDKRSVLDLGCGFCQYWPFLEMYGFNDFVGVDLFSLRGQGSQEYMKTAEDFSSVFCQKSVTKIYEADVRNIDSFLTSNKRFELIFTKNTNYKKLGSTGIPKEIFDVVVENRLSPNGIAIYAG